MGMSGGGGGPGGLQSEINVTPMVDIMLVLLIIFMVVTPFLQQGITVALPKNMNNPDVDPNIIKESSIVVSIPNDGEYYLGKQRVAREELTEKVDEDTYKGKVTVKLGPLAMVFAGTVRYRVPWDFVLALLAAFALERAWALLRRRRSPAAASAAP